MQRKLKSRAIWAVFALVLLVGAAAVAARLTGSDRVTAGSDKFALREFEESSQGVENGGSGGESAEALTAAQQWAEARTAPGIVAPGAYGNAFAELTGLALAPGSWSNTTRVPYDADDVNYRDYYSNSSGGAGKFVTGRVTGLAADKADHVYAAGANGGVWRSSTGGGNWEPIADAIPSLSSGALELDADGALWYATGEANTGGTSYVGNGVYKLSNPTSGSFTIANRVGGNELESTTINAIRFTADKVWVATLRGVWSHSRTTTTGPWSLSLVPNPTWLPDDLEPFLQTPRELGPTNGNDAISSLTNGPYKNIVNDLAIDPKDATHIVAAVGWRSGDTYNGFYETRNGGASWVKVNPTGAINPNDIGNVTFAYSAHGEKLYAINQAPSLLNKLTGTVNSYLDGIYVSKNGSPSGPWSKIAESQKLANSGSALKQSIGGKGYGPGIQAWYNQFLAVDPANPDHVWAGLEEVYETKDGGANWSTIGPYWNFYFPCWGGTDAQYPTTGGLPNNCPLTTHPDQHSIAVGTRGGTPTVFVGNDGGVYSRPVNGSVNGNGNATDWTTLNADGSMDALQYYAVDAGVADATKAGTPAGSGVVVSGGLQDNGGSIVRAAGAGRKMSSNFGGDGGDVLVDPNNGCNIVQEYVVLAMRVTQTCAHPETTAAFLDLSKSTTYSIAPPDINARFIAPFVANDTNIDQWLAGGNSVWFQKKGFQIRSGSEWAKVKTYPNPTQVVTALAMSGNTALAAWCGAPTCNNNGFNRGVSIGKYDATAGAPNNGWTWTDLALAGVPNRFVSGVAVDGNSLYLVLNGFSRRFTEGPGNGLGHVFKSTDNGATWTDIDANFPDVPANSIEILPDHSLVVGTDLGVVYKPAASATWLRLGANFPVTVAIDVELGPDNKLYVATHGRGIWSIDSPVAAAAGSTVAATGTGGAAGSTGGTGSTPPVKGGGKGKNG
jgi:hypothetical protein